MDLVLDAGSLLSTSPGADEGMARLARLAVGTFADICLIDIAEGGGAPRRVAAEVADPDLLELAERVAPEQAAARLGFISSIRVPLAARGGVLGSLTLATTALSGRRYAESDRRLAEDLARRAGHMLDRARLFEERRGMAQALRQSLVPLELPEIPGIELAARGLSGAGDAEVSGAFADVLSLGAGRWLVAVGGPAEKGPDGAWLAAAVRSTMRAEALDQELPSRMLTAVSAAVRRLAPGKLCRLACAFIEPKDGGAALTVSLAGHPPPHVVTAGGGMAAVGQPGAPLGAEPEPLYRDEPLALRLSDAVVFMTGAGRDPEGGTAADDRALVANARADSDGTARSMAAMLATSLEQSGPLTEDGE
ncbi:MAG TPA: SpoIIE family protein phosphatase, partial [Acidimicrobiales bacterium]|nr:SpoIIE family protein phosphatase [Acidimicrobiales bacterium]